MAVAISSVKTAPAEQAGQTRIEVMRPPAATANGAA